MKTKNKRRDRGTIAKFSSLNSYLLNYTHIQAERGGKEDIRLRTEIGIIYKLPNPCWPWQLI